MNHWAVQCCGSRVEMISYFGSSAAQPIASDSPTVIHMYVCMYVLMYMHTNVRTYICVCTVHTHVYITCMYVRVFHVCTYLCIHASHKCMCVHVYVCYGVL